MRPLDFEGLIMIHFKISRLITQPGCSLEWIPLAPKETTALDVVVSYSGCRHSGRNMSQRDRKDDMYWEITLPDDPH